MSSKAINYKQIWSIAIPIIIGGVAQNLVNITDTAFLGSLGKVELGAAGNAGLLYYLVVITGLGFATGAQIIIGRRNGERRFNLIGDILSHASLFLIPAGLFLSIILSIYSDEILSWLVKSSEVKDRAAAFLSIRSFGVVLAYAGYLFHAFFVGTTYTKPILVATAIMSGVNIVLDYLLIFGNMGFPEMGIKGAALASVIAELAALLYYFLVMFLMVDLKKYELFRLPSLKTQDLGNLIKVSLPLMVQSFVTLGSWFAFFSIIEHVGEDELAVSHIIRSIYMVIMIPIFGFSTATSTITSNLIGEGKLEAILPTVWRIIWMSLICTIPITLVVTFFSSSIFSIFTSEGLILEMAERTLIVIDFSMLFFCVAYILFNAVSGTGNTRYSLVIETLNVLIYLSATWCIVSYVSTQIHIIWCAEFIYFTCLALMSIFYLYKYNWQNLKL